MSRRGIPFLFVAFLLASSFSASAQSIENIQVAFTGQRVLITYDLKGKPEEKYRIQVYGSHNNFTTPLRFATGAVGEGITAGPAKTIEWNIAGDLTTFKGEITFRLKGEVMALPLSFQSPVANTTVKTGKKAEVKWAGGDKSTPVRIELLKDGNAVKPIGDASNTGSYSWTVPADLEKGTYNIKISSGTESVTSGPVIVKSPLPLWMKLTPLAVAAVVVVIVLLPDDDPKPPPTVDDLPNAPRPD